MLSTRHVNINVNDSGFVFLCTKLHVAMNGVASVILEANTFWMHESMQIREIVRYNNAWYNKGTVQYVQNSWRISLRLQHEPRFDISDLFCTLCMLFHNYRKTKYKRTHAFVRSLYVVPCSQTSSERAGWAQKHLITNKRNSMLETTVNDILFMHSCYKYCRKFNIEYL